MKVPGVDPAGVYLCRPSRIASHHLKVAEVVTQPDRPIIALAEPSFETESKKTTVGILTEELGASHILGDIDIEPMTVLVEPHCDAEKTTTVARDMPMTNGWASEGWRRW